MVFFGSEKGSVALVSRIAIMSASSLVMFDLRLCEKISVKQSHIISIVIFLR